MTLLSKLERLEKIATAREKGEALEPDPLFVTEICRILTEISTRPEPTIHEQIAWLRDCIRENEELPPDDFRGPFLPEWCRAELARLEALAAHKVPSGER